MADENYHSVNRILVAGVGLGAPHVQVIERRARRGHAVMEASLLKGTVAGAAMLGITRAPVGIM
jgi:hypothetical protein